MTETVHPWRRYIAIGDSFTEGMSDADPLIQGRYVGWADRLAAALSTQVPDGEFAYANLAVRGRKLDDVIGPQLDAALAAGPDLVSIVGGGNDILRPRVDLDEIADRLEQAVVRIRATGADVLMATPADPADAGLLASLRSRHAVHSANVFSIAQRQGAHVLNLWGLRALRDLRLWSTDRIHLSTEGHRRVAQEALAALAQPVSDPDWRSPLAPAPAVARREQVAETARWARSYAAPWVHRRLTGRSSGDSVTAKIAEPAPFGPADLPGA
ncbi:SGNH/GDSL hydrolase family protein [Janibacter sp. Soil728]|uniref:SGNH/GDSL hydrolase family protein n=1 Tax=Janibacter sp. Soil728 TaxID=1736393 RepID=UPI000A6D3FFC|nr:SGNH/GDSL hydrolase family protein [Janibacter sp. Soil728]